MIIPSSSYREKSYSNTFTVTYPTNYNDPKCKIVFGISEFDFKQSAASLSFVITTKVNGNGGGGTSSYDYTFQILNETMLYQVKVYSAIFDSSKINQILFESSKLTCTLMNTGMGYRSENVTFPTSDNPAFLPEANRIQAVVYYQGFNLFNPNGSFFYLSWQFSYNYTDFTILFKTMDANIVEFIDFSVLIVDMNLAEYVNDYRRLFIVETVACSMNVIGNCPGKSEWLMSGFPNAPADHNASASYLFGLTSFQITKHTDTAWKFDQSNLLNLANAYYQSPSMIWANISIFIVSRVNCVTNSHYFDPSTMKTCDTTCPNPLYPNQFNPPGPGSNKLCKACHYSCDPGFCQDETINKCTQCDGTKFRVQSNNGANFRCDCMTGYVDVGAQLCQPCSKYVLGCATCNSPTNCLTCDIAKGFTATPSSPTLCSCNSPTKYMSLQGFCRSTYGCVNYFNDPVKGWVCLACNFTLNLFMDNYTCSCVAGYTMITNPDGTKFCQVLPAVCGDGIRVASEPCDDGNLENNDGCSDACLIEVDFLCFGDLRQTSFCIESRTTLTYVGAMKIQGLKTAQLYFSLKPYNQQLQNVNFLLKWLSTTITNITSMTNLTYYTTPNLDQDQLRIRLHLDFTQTISSTINHSMTLYIYDNTHFLNLTTKFNIKGANLQLTVEQGYQNLSAMNYILAALVVLAFIALFVSLFKENWIGIELMHTFQFCFFYFVLLEDIDEKQVKFLSYLEFCNGYNDLEDHLSLYEYMDFNRKIYLMNFRKEILINFNFTSFLFLIPVILLIVKVIRSCLQKDQTTKTTNGSKVIQTKWDVYLSSEFIIGKVFITFCLVFMNQILFSFFIQQTPYLQEDEMFNGLFAQIFLFVMVSCCFLAIGLLIMAALRPFKFNNPTNEDQVFEQVVEYVKFKRFNALYPAIYSIFIAVKIIFMAMFYTNKSAVYFMWALEIIYMVVYAIWRPYKKMREVEDNYCYLLHNMHNMWNSFGLSVLIGVLLMENLKVNPDTYIMNVSIRITILIVEIISLILAYLRLYGSKKLTQIKLPSKDQEEIEYTYEEKQQIEETERKVRKQTKFEGKDKKDSPPKNREKKETLLQKTQTKDFQEQNKQKKELKSQSKAIRYK